MLAALAAQGTSTQYHKVCLLCVCCAGREAGGLKSSTHLLVKPIKNQNASKLILGVLGVLQVRVDSTCQTLLPVSNCLSLGKALS